MSESDGLERSKTREAASQEATQSLFLRRRELKLGIQRVELRLYRRTRTSSEIFTKPPHFVYIIRCSWDGEQSSCRSLSSPRGPPPRSQSPRVESPRGFEEPWPWWESLPKCYTVRRRWHEIVRFHEALKHELANDPVLGCRRVKAKLPVLPDPADVDSWLKTYAATNDACALGRSAVEVQRKAACFQGVICHGHAYMCFCVLVRIHANFVSLRSLTAQGPLCESQEKTAYSLGVVGPVFYLSVNLTVLISDHPCFALLLCLDLRLVALGFVTES
ncbi:unnamed protein product [Symbiodinium sp. CCMP2592]|nr:unnamed protein product [Symbiodinium sp. CCMP2592]